MICKSVPLLVVLAVLGVSADASRILLSPNQSRPAPTSSQTVVTPTAAVATSRTFQSPLIPSTPIIIPTTISTTALSCTTIQDVNMPEGRLCISQVITTTTRTPQPNCARYSQECLKTTTQTRLLRPTGTAVTNAVEYNLSAEAACKQLGYTTAGSGSVHITGSNPAARQLCWNGQEWSTDNWWVSLVCCK